MTNNVINYLGKQEEKRANQAREAEMYRHNAIQEALQRELQIEAARHNAAVETHNYRSLQEQIRANKASESLTSLATSQRAEAARISAAAQRYGAELSSGASRYATATQATTAANALAEAGRHNVAQEYYQSWSALLNSATQKEINQQKPFADFSSGVSGLGNTAVNALRVVGTLLK